MPPRTPISPTSPQQTPSSSCRTCHFPSSPPVLTIIPSTIPHLPTPPLTPLTPLTPCLKPSSKTSSPTAYFPITPKIVQANTILAGIAIPPSTISSVLPTDHNADGEHHLHAPLVTHLTLLHPNTPREIIHFCATRLLSTERPYGFPYGVDGASYPPGERKDDDDQDANKAVWEETIWKPVWAGHGDLATAGLGREAAKGCEQVGPGKKEDERLEWMYEVARRSWGMLERKGPGQGDRL